MNSIINDLLELSRLEESVDKGDIEIFENNILDLINDAINECEYAANKKQIKFAVDRSLKDLKTDYIDLYQVHWPDRPSGPFSGRLEYEHKGSDNSIGIDETLDALNDLVKNGKVSALSTSLQKRSKKGQVVKAASQKVISISNGHVNGVHKHHRVESMETFT